VCRFVSEVLLEVEWLSGDWLSGADKARYASVFGSGLDKSFCHANQIQGVRKYH